MASSFQRLATQQQQIQQIQQQQQQGGVVVVAGDGGGGSDNEVVGVGGGEGQPPTVKFVPFTMKRATLMRGSFSSTELLKYDLVCMCYNASEARILLTGTDGFYSMLLRHVEAVLGRYYTSGENFFFPFPPVSLSFPSFLSLLLSLPPLPPSLPPSLFLHLLSLPLPPSLSFQAPTRLRF